MIIPNVRILILLSQSFVISKWSFFYTRNKHVVISLSKSFLSSMW